MNSASQATLQLSGAKYCRIPAAFSSVLELGTNVGLNLKAIRALLPEASLSGVEINQKAASELKAWGHAEVYNQSLLDFVSDKLWDLAFTKGVLIHMPPERLPDAYDALYNSSSRYICVAEYYNPTPMTIEYRGNEDKLFKRDFAGELMDRFPALRLIEYGFVWKRDPVFPADDVTWFLLEKIDSQ